VFNHEDVERILQGIVKLNTVMGPFGVAVPVFFAMVVLLLLLRCYTRPGRKSSTALIGTLVVVYVFSGFAILAGKDEMGAGMAWMGAAVLWMVALLLVIDMIFYWTEVGWPRQFYRRALSLSFMAIGIFLYPLAEMALGFTWPRMVLFGAAECPTTIFLIGLFIGCVPRVNKPLFVIISLNAMATGFSVAVNGAPFDLLYAAAGLAGATVIVKDFREIFGRHRNHDPALQGRA
jgi:hypothetical protein